MMYCARLSNSDIDDPPAKKNKAPADDTKTLSDIPELLANPGPSKAPAKKKPAKKTARSKKKTIESEEEDDGKISSVEENQVDGPQFSDEAISISSDNSWDSGSMICQNMDGSQENHEGKDAVTDYDCTYCLEKWKPGDHKGTLKPCC